MAGNELKEKLCRGLDAAEDDPLRKVEKVLAPFLRTLKKSKHQKSYVAIGEQEEFSLKKFQKDMLSSLQSVASEPLKQATLFNETAELLKVATNSKGVNLYLTSPDKNELYLCPKYIQSNPRHEKRYTIETGTYLAPHVAYTKEYVISSDILGDVRFPQGIPEVPTVKAALCVPIITNEDENCAGVIELYRDCTEKAYTLTNLQVCTALTGWMGVAIEEHKMKNKFHLQVVVREQIGLIATKYFSTLVPFSRVVSDVVRVTKIAASAEKGAFYIFHDPVSSGTKDTIYAEAFEEAEVNPLDACLYKKGNKVRFARNEPGIAGYVARSGEIVNIRDAYKDPRFDKKTDSVFVRTRSVIGFPIKNEHGVIAVLLLINCTNFLYFREQDAELVKAFLTPIGLICNHFLLENSFIKTEQRLIVTDKLLDYHMKPTNEEVTTLKNAVQQLSASEFTLTDEFFNVEYDVSIHEDEAHKYITYFFLNLDFLSPFFETQKFIHFILRTKKAYRPVMFHNFEHAFSVFHCALTIILKAKESSPGTFRPLEVISILLAAICHDVGHYGLTNNFIALKNDAIYKLYGDFCGEAHRYNLAIFIIQQSDLLINMSSENYEFITRNLKKFIVGFDLSMHFQHKKQLYQIINEEKFDWENSEHRFLVQHFILIAADYSYNYKHFEHAKKETYLFYKELHLQGDMENMMGFTPTVMMDRNKSEVIPENQKIMLTVIALPCVQVLGRLFPALTVLENLLEQTLEKWNEIIALRGLEMWNLNTALFREKRERRTRRVTVTSTVSSIRTLSNDSKMFMG